MDFSALKSIQTQTRNLSQGREAEARKAYQEGLQLFHAYNQHPDKERLKKAMGKMLESIQFKRNYLEPYLMLASVYQAMEVPKQAIKFFRLAQQLAPQDERVLMLQETLSKGVKSQFERPDLRSALPETSQGSTDEEYDLLFHEVEDLLQGELADYLRNLELPLAPNWDPEVVKRLDTYLLELKFYGMEIDLKLQLMEDALDTLTLKSQIHSFESQKRRIQLLRNQCLRFSDMKGKMDRFLEKVLREKSAPNPHHLDALLDDCDAFADQLDALAEKNISIEALHPTYRRMVDEITKLQDLLDDSVA